MSSSLRLERTPLSILNLASYPRGARPGDAFATTRRIAQHGERCGYHRFWLAEHHNLEGIASAATSVLIGNVAGATRRIRVGSGGIMLPNHAPLAIAEQFGTLESLYPGRIDLGLGRAPGGDFATMRALRAAGGSADDFPALIAELVDYLGPPHPHRRVRAIPGEGLEIPIWILGSSLYSAELAAELGRPYAFAAHFAPTHLLEALRLYRARFRPSAWFAAPHVMVAIPVVAAESDERAEYLATSLYQRFAGIVRGERGGTPPPVASLEKLWDPAVEATTRAMLKSLVVGGPQKIRRGLDATLEATGADELMISSELYDPNDTLRSYEIIARVAGRRIDDGEADPDFGRP